MVGIRWFSVSFQLWSGIRRAPALRDGINLKMFPENLLQLWIFCMLHSFNVKHLIADRRIHSPSGPVEIPHVKIRCYFFQVAAVAICPRHFSKDKIDSPMITISPLSRSFYFYLGGQSADFCITALADIFHS